MTTFHIKNIDGDYEEEKKNNLFTLLMMLSQSSMSISEITKKKKIIIITQYSKFAKKKRRNDVAPADLHAYINRLWFSGVGPINALTFLVHVNFNVTFYFDIMQKKKK